MPERIDSLPLNECLDELSELFSGYAGAVFLRGSLLRREPPYDDLDIMEVSDETPHDSADIPRTYKGARVAYRHLTITQWEEYLRDCPRSWYMFYDIAILRSERHAEQIFHTQKNSFLATKEPDYVAYDHADFLSSVGNIADTSNTEYEYAKGIPGSKRSIMRSAFTLKALYPEYRLKTTPELLRACGEDGRVPEFAPETADEVYRLLSEKPVDTAAVAQAAGRCLAWMTDLAHDTDRYLKEKLPQTYLTTLGRAALSREAEELVGVHEDFHGQELPYRQWTLAYFLAKNPSTPREVRSDIADFYRQGYVGRVIRDVLESQPV